MCVSNPDGSPVGIDRGDAAPTPTSFAEIINNDFPVLHRLGPLLLIIQERLPNVRDLGDAGFSFTLSSLLRADGNAGGKIRYLAPICFNWHQAAFHRIR
jgi:hypothetical protein